MAKKILVVDDERHIVLVVQGTLKSAGYEVITAADGKDALEKVEAEKPDLVVLDEVMPDMDGFEVLKRLRKNPATRELPVIMLTLKTGVADGCRHWQSDPDCYLSKPFNPMELVAFVRRIFTALNERDENPDPGRPVLD